MEVTERTISGVPLRIRGISGKTRCRVRKVLSLLAVIAIVIVNYAFVRGINHLRYDVDTFNCVDFTAETLDVLDTLGITSYQVVGYCHNKSVGHSWVGIDFFGYIFHYEPQTFLFFNPFSEYDVIVMKCGDNATTLKD